MRCELCEASIQATSVALVEAKGAVLPEGTTGVATLTAQICVGCWEKLDRPLSCFVHRGRILGMEDIFPLDMRPIDLERAVAASRVDMDDEARRADELKNALNRMVVLTFHDPFRAESVVIHRDDWTDPLQIALTMVEMVRSLKQLGKPEVDEILERAGVRLEIEAAANPEEPT